MSNRLACRASIPEYNEKENSVNIDKNSKTSHGKISCCSRFFQAANRAAKIISTETTEPIIRPIQVKYTKPFKNQIYVIIII